jgi:biotin transport system substrate-specific component
MPAQSLTLSRRRPGVLADLIPGVRVRDVAVTIGAACFVGLLAQVSLHLSWTPVPITGQTLSVVVAGSALGARRGGAALALYAIAGLAGVPWFAGHASGFAEGTFGYIIGFFVASVVCGHLAERRADRNVLSAIPAMIVGDAIIFLIGVPWLAVVYHFSPPTAIAKGVTPFLPGEAIKMALAAGALPAAWRIAGRSGKPRSA